MLEYGQKVKVWVRDQVRCAEDKVLQSFEFGKLSYMFLSLC